MEKIFKGSVIGLLAVLVVFSILSYFGSSDKFGSTTAGDINIGGNLSVTGTTTQTGALSVAANLNANGGFIERGTYDYGETGSISMTATIFCDYRGATFDVDGGSEPAVAYASISLPEDEALIADCLANEGYKRFTLDGTSSTSTAIYEIVTTDLVWRHASAACEMASNDASEPTSDELLLLEAWYNGIGSVSWSCDAITSSTSFQP